MYLPKPPKRLVRSTDADGNHLHYIYDYPKPKQFEKEDVTRGYAFRRIEGDWYIYYEFNASARLASMSF